MIAAALLCVGATSAAGAQNSAPAGDARPAFEVATLKPSADRMIMCMVPERNGDRFTCHNGPLLLMIAYAYNVPVSRIEGMNGLYSVGAKIDPSATEQQARLMLQSLLEERLKLVVRRETRQVQGYTLVVGRNGLKIKEADASAEPPPWPPYITVPVTELQGRALTVATTERGVMGTVGRNAPISQLAEQLSNVMKVPVVDRTGLNGKYYFELKFQNPAYETSTTDENYTPAPDLSSALPDQLGLKLEKAKVQAEYLVVEHWEAPKAE